MADYKNIAVKSDTCERFKQYGMFGETEDDMMKVILDLVDKTIKFVEQTHGQHESSAREPIIDSNR